MASGLPASPFAAAPQASLPNVGWGIEWSSAEGRWVAAAQPGAKPQTGEAALPAQPQPQDGQTSGLPEAGSVPGNSLAQLERVGSAGEPSAASEAGQVYQHAGAGAAFNGELPLQSASQPEGKLSRQQNAASEGGPASDKAVPPHAAEGATGQLGSLAPGTVSRKNSSCLEEIAGPDSSTAQRCASGGPSKYRGVIWHKSNSKWEARIYENGKQRFLGYYTSEEEAARVYDEAAARMTGRAVNFPNDLKGPALEESLSRANSVSNEPLDQEGSASKLLSRGRPRKKPAADSQPPALKGSSKYRGVSWNSSCNKWRAQVWKGSDVRHLGYFDSEADAAKAYDRAAVELRGPAAPTNFDSTDLLSEVAAAEHVAAGLPEATQEEMDRVDSFFLGVSWDDAKSCWKAEIWDGAGYTLLGHFDTEDGAARAYDRACLKLHAAEANTNYPPQDYEGELQAAALLSAVPLSAAAVPGASEAGNSDEEDARRSELELSAMHALASISSDEAESFDSKEQASAAEQRQARALHEGVARHLSNPTPEGPASMPPAPRSAMSDPIERSAPGLRRRKSARISDADAATAAAALAGLTGKPAARPSRSMSPEHSMSAGTSMGRRNSGRSGPVASDQAKSSAYKGVSWHKHSQKWYAYIQSGGKMRGLGYFDSQADAAKAYDAEARKVHGKKAVVNFRLSSGEIQWQPRNKRGMSNSSAETSCPSFGASPEASEQSGSAGPRLRTGQRNPSRASSGRSERAHSASPALEQPAASHAPLAEEKVAAGKPAARSRLAAESGFARMSTQRPASAAGEKPPATLAPLNMANIPPFQADRDGEGSPTESCMSMDSIPMRKRSRKPKHVYNAADVAPLQAPWKSSVYKPVQKPVKKDPLETVKTLPADLDRPMVLRSKDGARSKRSRAQTSPPPRPATSSGTEPERREPRTLFKGVSRLEKERKWVARVWVDSKQRTLGRYDSDVAAAQAYDRAVLRMKGADAATNFPASMYEDSDNIDPLGPLQTADASCTISLPDAGVSGESDHPSPSRPCNAPLPLFKARAAARLSPLGPHSRAEPNGGGADVPGTKATSSYRGVSWNKAIGQWMAVAWNFQERKTQIVGNYASEIEAAKAYDRAVTLNGGAVHQLNFPFSPELEADMDATDADGAAGRPEAVRNTLQDLAQHAAASQPTQGPGAEPGDQEGEPGQLTPAMAYHQLASILRANPDASPLIAQALHNMQHSASGRQGSFTEIAPEAAPGRRGHVEPVQHPVAVDERPPPSRPMPYQRPSRDGLTRNRVQAQAVMKNSSRYRGVSLNKASRKWEARIRESGKNHYLGSFTDEEMAARAFDNAAIAMRGPQAVCNFPREGSNVKVHTFGHAPSRQIMVRASPDEPYHAVSPRSGPPPAGPFRGVQQLPVVESGTPRLVHYDKDSGMWIADRGGAEAESESSQEPRAPALGTALPSGNSPGGLDKRPPFLADLANDDIPRERRSPLQRVPSGQVEPDEARLPGPGPGRRSSKYKGVSWAEASLKWRTQIWTGTKVQYIGYYDDEMEAAKAYDRAILKFRGAGHQVNFPEADYTPEEIASAPKVEPQGDDPFALQSASPRAGYAERQYEGSPRARSSGRGSLSPRQASQPKTVPTGRAAPDSQVYHQGTSQFKGVSWAERSKKWRAQLWFGNKVNHLGFFEYEEEAARAYDAAARAIRGPQASTNFPDAVGGAPVSARTITTSGRPGDSSTVVETIPRINVNPKGSSMYKGVRWHERNGKWEARIFDSAAQKQVSLGYYENEVDAARAYDAESLRLRGPNGHINLPESRALIDRRTQDEDGGEPVYAGSAEMADDRWAIKRPRGTNPAIERGDLEAIAAAATAIGSVGRSGSALGRHSWYSRFRGVVWDEESQKWAVCLSPGDGAVERQLGLFLTEEAAAGAYDALAIELWGPSTPTNFHSQGVAALPEGSHVPKKPRTDSAAANRHSAAMYVLDSGDRQPSAPAPPASSLKAASPRQRLAALDEAKRREDESSAAAASNLVDFFQSAAQRWQAPFAAEPAAGSDSATQEPLVSGGSHAQESKEAGQSQVPPAAPPSTETDQRPAAGLAQITNVADPSYGLPVVAAIQSWQQSACGPGPEASGAASGSPPSASEPLDARPQTVLVSPSANAIKQAGKPAAASKDAATAPVIPAEAALAAAVTAPAAQLLGDKGAPNLITPPKEAVVSNAASRPFSADTA